MLGKEGSGSWISTCLNLSAATVYTLLSIQNTCTYEQAEHTSVWGGQKRQLSEVYGHLGYVHTSIAASIYIGSYVEVTKQFSNVHHWTSFNLLGSVQDAFIFDGKTVCMLLYSCCQKWWIPRRNPCWELLYQQRDGFLNSVFKNLNGLQRVDLNHTKHINN